MRYEVKLLGGHGFPSDHVTVEEYGVRVLRGNEMTFYPWHVIHSIVTESEYEDEHLHAADIDFRNSKRAGIRL